MHHIMEALEYSSTLKLLALQLEAINLKRALKEKNIFKN